jgi:hypothetical protein
MNPIVMGTLHTVGIMMLFLLMHWVATCLYTTFCVQTSMIGIVYSLFTASSPVCRTILEIQYKTIGFYDATFLFMATTIVQSLSNLLQTIKRS